MILLSYLCVGIVVKKNIFKSKYLYNVGIKFIEIIMELIDNCVWLMKICWYYGVEKL